MRSASLAALLYVAIACTPPEPVPPGATTVEVTPPPALETVPEAPEAPPPAPPAGETAPAPAPSPPAEPEAEPAPKQPTPAEVKACAARGGKIEPVCMTAQPTCVIRYRDAGKRCTDKADCQGECLYEGEQPPPPKPSGHCQATSDPCGCKAPMLKGVVQPMMCVD